MHRGALLGIIGGLIVFAVILSFISYGHSDFDGQLITQVDNDVPSEKLTTQIDKETQTHLINAKRRYESYVMDQKYWGNGDLASSGDYQYYTQNYENDLKMINGMDNVRKKFARREISEDQFLSDSKQYKEYFSIYY